MSGARDEVEASGHQAPQRPQKLPAGQRILAWATALAVLLGGMNAFVQMARLALGP